MVDGILDAASVPGAAGDDQHLSADVHDICQHDGFHAVLRRTGIQRAEKLEKRFDQ